MSLTPREEFEEQFGSITDDKWEWLKQFCLRNPVTDSHNGVTYIDYNEYSVRDEKGDWWLIGGPNGPIKTEQLDPDKSKEE
jgi:hypothetical protein